MVFQEFDKKNRERLKDLREKKKEAQSSSSVWHEQYTPGEGRALANVHERGLQQEQEQTFGGSLFSGKNEKDRESRMEEIFHTENAFARISLGLNEKGESVFVTSRKMRSDIKSTERSERELDEQRSYNWHVVGGDDKANYNKPGESAFGFYQTGYRELDPHTRAQRMVGRSQEFANLTGNLMTEEFIPSKSFDAGKTKELSARQMKLEHQLAIALERGKKKIEEKKDKEIFPHPKKKEDILYNEDSVARDDSYGEGDDIRASSGGEPGRRTFGTHLWEEGLKAAGASVIWTKRRKMPGKTKRRIPLRSRRKRKSKRMTVTLTAAGLLKQPMGLMSARQKQRKALSLWWPGLLLLSMAAMGTEEDQPKKEDSRPRRQEEETEPKNNASDDGRDEE